jgi:hypothetical protein
MKKEWQGFLPYCVIPKMLREPIGCGAQIFEIFIIHHLGDMKQLYSVNTPRMRWLCKEKAKGIKENCRKIEGIRKTTREKQDSWTDIYMQGTTGFPVLFTWSPFGLFFCASGARQRAPFTLLNNNNVYGSRWNYSFSLCGWKRRRATTEIWN